MTYPAQDVTDKVWGSHFLLFYESWRHCGTPDYSCPLHIAVQVQLLFPLDMQKVVPVFYGRQSTKIYVSLLRRNALCSNCGKCCRKSSDVVTYELQTESSGRCFAPVPLAHLFHSQISLAALKYLPVLGSTYFNHIHLVGEYPNVWLIKS